MRGVRHHYPSIGMSMGYGDPDASVNRACMPREGVHGFARLLGF